MDDTRATALQLRAHLSIRRFGPLLRHHALSPIPSLGSGLSRRLDLARQLRDARGDGLVSEHARLGNTAFVHPVAASAVGPASLWHSPGIEARQSRQTDAANAAVSPAMGVANGGPYHAF